MHLTGPSTWLGCSGGTPSHQQGQHSCNMIYGVDSHALGLGHRSVDHGGAVVVNRANLGLLSYGDPRCQGGAHGKASRGDRVTSCLVASISPSSKECHPTL